jgi:hypothetical protein
MKLGWSVGALVVVGFVGAGCTGGSPADQRCAGYLGCSAGQTVGIHDPKATPTAKDVDAVLPGPGCGQPLPADQPTTVPARDGLSGLGFKANRARP